MVVLEVVVAMEVVAVVLVVVAAVTVATEVVAVTVATQVVAMVEAAVVMLPLEDLGAMTPSLEATLLPLVVTTSLPATLALTVVLVETQLETMVLLQLPPVVMSSPVVPLVSTLKAPRMMTAWTTS
jgi:hypothetical protein